MTDLNQALTMAAPLYNLVFICIATVLFIMLFREKQSQVFLTPWICLFGGMSVFVLETAFTILRSVGIINLPVHVNGFFELTIISLFIYALFAQQQHINATSKNS